MSAPVRISIVAHGLRAGGGISVGKNCIQSLMTAMPDACYQIFIPAGIGYEEVFVSSVSVQAHEYVPRLGKIGRFLFDDRVLPGRLKKFAPDVVICLGNIGVKSGLAPQILLVQDSHYFYPECHYARASRLEKIVYRLQRYRLAQDLKRTRVLLCQTRSAMNRLQQWYGFEGAVHLFPNAISTASLAGLDNPRIDPRVQGDFRLFYLTRYYPHKNIELFVDLFSRHRQALKGVVVHLTLCESHGRGARLLLERIRAEGLENHIVNLGPIPQEDLAGIFRSMHALVMPSTLESFSGTYLEAMSFGCPVVTSDLDFAREVCGDAALYFDPWQADSLFNSVQTLRENADLSARLIANGQRICQEHTRSWQQNAEVLRHIILELILN